MIHKYLKGRVYVFIDAANLECSVKSLNWWIDYRKLYEYFQDKIDLVGIRHYCPWLKDAGQDKFFYGTETYRDKAYY